MITVRRLWLNTGFSGSPLSAQFAAGDNASRKYAFIDQLYLRWKPGTSALIGVRLTWRTADGDLETLASLYMGDGVAEAAAKA